MRRILLVPVFTQAMIWTLVVTTLLIGWCPPQGWAMLAPAVTAEAGADPGRAADLQTIQRALESKVVQQRLLDWGLTAEETQARLAKLSDEELHQLATQIDTLMPGGDALGIIIILLVIAIVVVLVLYLTGSKVVVEKSDGVVEKK